MSTDQSALLSGIRTGASATNTVGTAVFQRFVNITGVNGQNDTIALPWDASALNLRVIITTAGGATASNSYTLKKVGVAADVLKIASIGSATGSFSTVTTTSASLIAFPNNGTAPSVSGSQDPITMKVSAIAADTAVRGIVVVSYNRTNGSTDGYM